MAKLINRSFLSILRQKAKEMKEHRNFSGKVKRLYSDAVDIAEEIAWILQEEGLIGKIKQSKTKYSINYSANEHVYEDIVDVGVKVAIERIGEGRLKESILEIEEEMSSINNKTINELNRKTKEFIEALTKELLEDVTHDTTMHSVALLEPEMRLPEGGIDISYLTGLIAEKLEIVYRKYNPKPKADWKIVLAGLGLGVGLATTVNIATLWQEAHNIPTLSPAADTVFFCS